jgi:hypothetical protein
MSVRSSFVAVVVVVGILTGAFLPSVVPRAVFAQATPIEFAVPTSIPITPTNPPTEPGDVVLVTGQPVGFTDASGCVSTAGSYPVENVVVVDPGSGNRATRMANVIITSQTDALKPGTKLVDMTASSPCTMSGGIQYIKYRGTPQ